MALQAEMQYNEEYGELARWACGTIDISDFVRVICNCFKIFRPKLIFKWGTEAFQWFVGSRDPRVSICAQEIYRAILEPSSAETLDASALRLLEVLRSLEIVKVVSHAKDSRDPELALAVSKAEEILITYQAQVPMLEDLFLLQRIFWISVSVLLCSHLIVKELHVHVHRILLALEERSFFSRISSEAEPALIVFQRIASEWNFSGLQSLLATGLYVRKTGDLVARLLCKMPAFSLGALVECSPCRHGLTVLNFLPWLLQKLSVARLSSEDDDFLPFEIARVLADSLKQGSAPLPETIDLLDRYANNQLLANDDEYLLDSVSAELFVVYFREDPKQLCDALAAIMQVVVSAQPIYYRNVVRTVGKFVSKPWAERDRAHFGRIIRMASQSLQQDSSRVLMNMVIANFRSITDAASFQEQTRPIPHLTSTIMSTTASKMIFSLLKAKLPKSSAAFRQVMRKQTEKRPLSPRRLTATLAQRQMGSRSQVAMPSTSRVPPVPAKRDGSAPIVPVRPAAPSPSNAGAGTAQGSLQPLVVTKGRTSVGRGAGRGAALPPRKPLPPMAGSNSPPIPVSNAANATAQGSTLRTAAALLQSSEEKAASSKPISVLDTTTEDEEEEPTSEDEEDSLEQDEDEGAELEEMLVDMSTILTTPRMRCFFDDWSSRAAKPIPEVLFFDALTQLQDETDSAKAIKKGKLLTALHVGAGSTYEVPLPAELVAQIKEKAAASTTGLPPSLVSQAIVAVSASMDTSLLPTFRGSYEYLSLLAVIVSDSAEVDNPFLDHDDVEESNDRLEDEDQEQNPYVGGDIEELADLAQNLVLDEGDLVIGQFE